MKKNNKPKIGQDIYIPSAMYISRGSDDRVGGLAKIVDVEFSETLPEDHFNYCFVSVEEIPNVSFNYNSLMKQQEELKKQFGNNRAYPDPDIDTPWIEDGDWVDGKENSRMN